MSTVSQLIALTVGRRDFTAFEPWKGIDDASPFHVFSVTLPIDSFRGFPRDWLFAVLDEAEVSSRTEAGHVFRQARRILDKRDGREPLVFICSDTRFHMGDEFTLPKRHVLSLDAHDIPEGLPENRPSRIAPLVLAFRRVLDEKDPALIWFSPYQRAKPVSGWRFFGRTAELNALTHSDENYLLIGARRVGKTSLMLEAHRALQEIGETSYYIDVQHCTTPHAVVSEIIRMLSVRERAAAVRRSKALDEQMFSHVLRTISAKSSRVTIFLDELGNVIAHLSDEDWVFLGMLRRAGQSGNVRFVVSCFQEVFLRQPTSFAGPLTNFATPLRLRQFDDSEVEEFVLAPLEFWEPLGEQLKRQLSGAVRSVVGRHPYLLQFFCHALIQSTLDSTITDHMLNRAHALLRNDDWLVKCFSEPVREVFFCIPSAAIMYLFVRKCAEADFANEELRRVEILDEWVETTLRNIGYETTVSGRRLLLEGLEVHGLTSGTSGNPLRQTISAPIVYLYLKRTEKRLDGFLAKLARDIARETKQWSLEPAPDTVA